MWQKQLPGIFLGPKESQNSPTALLSMVRGIHPPLLILSPSPLLPSPSIPTPHQSATVPTVPGAREAPDPLQPGFMGDELSLGQQEQQQYAGGSPLSTWSP